MDPVDYGTDWHEDVAPDEDARFEALAERLSALQRERDAHYDEKGRALHRKAIGGAAATFTVREDLAAVLPEALHVGPFTPGATWSALVRFSNGSYRRGSDQAPDFRGLAIKLLDVPGKKALTGTEEPTSQDFLLIQVPTTATSSPDEFVTVVELTAIGSPATLPLRMMWAIGPLRALSFLRRGVRDLRRTIPSFPGGRFHSAVPFRFGPTAAHFALSPVGPPTPAAGGGRDALREQLQGALRDGFAFDFQVQLYQDPTQTPIEESTVAWTSPFHTVARLEVTPCDPDSEAAKDVARQVESLSFDPWHAVEELRPLGAFNRARKIAYYASIRARDAAPEPTASTR